MTKERGGTRVFAAPSTSCRACAVRHDCDRIEGQEEFFGCYMHHVGTDKCRKRGWTCPCNPEYADRWRQAKTRPGYIRPLRALRGLARPLPQYVPVVHGDRYRVQPLESRVVAIPLNYTLRTVDGRYGPVARDPVTFRRYFGLRDDAEVFVVGVGADPVIERYWEHRNAARIAEALSGLGLAGMTCPNYSFFRDAPRPHTLWNRARMHLVLDELSDAGVTVIPHLNAAMECDWRFWAALLRASPSVRVVAKEFQLQTGNGRWEVGFAAITRLRRLQDEVGRALHPVLVGGAQFAEEAAQAFPTFTIVDASPYMKAVKRQMAYRDGDTTVRWRGMEGEPGEPIDGLMEHNIALYSSVLDVSAGRARGLPEVDDQPELPLPSASGRPADSR